MPARPTWIFRVIFGAMKYSPSGKLLTCEIYEWRHSFRVHGERGKVNMASVWDYSATAASNNGASPNGMAEGCAPSIINDVWRQSTANMFEGLAKSTVAGGTADA